ncbi:unnamed protein product [marine sediment metagenome]|uniref:LamG-like jellyroll fold domain-containing protein n=1 Tax=marine sediment metagenome TaxID=412755 RepID=X1GZF0_9ZZZZ
MKAMLTDLPDLAAYWKLDLATGALTQDSSRNSNHGTVIGASPAQGQIDGAYSFDGLNDRIDCGTDSSLNLRDQITIEAHIKRDSIGTNDLIVNRRDGAAPAEENYTLQILGNNKIQFAYRNEANTATHEWRSTPLIDDLGFHYIGLSFTFGTGASLICVLDHKVIAGIWAGGTGNVLPIDLPAIPLFLGATTYLANWFHGILDHIPIHSRALDATELIRHSYRAY